MQARATDGAGLDSWEGTCAGCDARDVCAPPAALRGPRARRVRYRARNRSRLRPSPQRASDAPHLQANLTCKRACPCAHQPLATPMTRLRRCAARPAAAPALTPTTSTREVIDCDTPILVAGIKATSCACCVCCAYPTAPCARPPAALLHALRCLVAPVAPAAHAPIGERARPARLCRRIRALLTAMIEEQLLAGGSVLSCEP